MGDRPTEVLLMAAYEKKSTRPPEHESDEVEKRGLSQGVTWRMSLDWEVLGLTNQVRCQCPSKPKPGLTRMHREMNSEATSSGSPLRAAVPPKRAKVTQKVQTNETIQDLDEMTIN